jgi:TrpR-related protein YerC/YecD
MKNHPSKKPRTGDYQQLFRAIASLRSPAETADFLTDLCTPAELEALADRWRAVRMLKDGRTYREINGETGMSVTTIGRVARFLAFGRGGYERIWQRLQRSGR